MKKSWIILLSIPLFISFAMTACQQSNSRGKPNVIYVLTDQWRASAVGMNTGSMMQGLIEQG